MTDPTTASTTNAVFPAVFTDAGSRIPRWCTLPWLMSTFVLALMLANCTSTSNSNSSGGPASGGAASSGGASAGASGSNTGGTAPTETGGSGGSGGASGSGGGSGGAPVAMGGSASTGDTATGGGGSSALGTGGSGGSSVAGSGGAANSDGSLGAGGGGGSPAETGGRGGGGGIGSGGAAGSAATGDAGNAFTLTSPDHMEGAKFDTKFTCAASNGTFGSGVNPELDWHVGVPDGTKSFAITFIDTTLGETSAMGQHWAIWNIPATVTKFPQATATLTGDLATAKQSGKFLTPCAQSLVNNVDDQYEFTVYALATATLNITGTTVANALTALKAITPLATAKLRGHAGLKGK